MVSLIGIIILILLLLAFAIFCTVPDLHLAAAIGYGILVITLLISTIITNEIIALLITVILILMTICHILSIKIIEDTFYDSMFDYIISKIEDKIVK